MLRSADLYVHFCNGSDFFSIHFKTVCAHEVLSRETSTSPRLLTPPPGGGGDSHRGSGCVTYATPPRPTTTREGEAKVQTFF